MLDTLILNKDKRNSSFSYFRLCYSYIGWNICNWFTKSCHSKFKKTDGYYFYLIAEAGPLMYLHIENEGSKIFILTVPHSLILQLNWKFI